jgi:DNA-binding NtrC family response regulator
MPLKKLNRHSSLFYNTKVSASDSDAGPFSPTTQNLRNKMDHGGVDVEGRGGAGGIVDRLQEQKTSSVESIVEKMNLIARARRERAKVASNIGSLKVLVAGDSGIGKVDTNFI